MIGRAPRLVIVGAGPAGLTAAATGSRLGFDVTVIDENRTLGGQYFRGRQASRNPGSPEWFRRRAATHVLLDTTVFDVPADDAVSVWNRAGGSRRLPFDALIVATGAYDRPVPLPGWTLPGVFTAGGAHTLAKAYGVLPGARVVVAGSGPFLLPVADVLAAHGAATTVVEATPLATSMRGLRSIVRDRELLGQTIGYLARLTARGVGRRYGEIVTEIHGDRRVEAATISAVDNEWQPLAGSERTLGADAVCLGYGFVPQLEVAQLAGCSVTYLEDSSDFAVWTDGDMRTSKPRIYAAGEVTGIAGVRAAVLKGALAALAAAADLDVGTPADREHRRRAIGARLERLRPTAEWIRQAFRPRPGLWRLASADTLICRCEDISLGQVEDVLALNAVSPFAVKTATRLGMGLCQGRICSPYVIERLRAVHGYVVPREGRPWVVRPPLRPIPLGSLADGVTTAGRGNLARPDHSRYPRMSDAPGSVDAVVIGGGVIGAACLEALAAAGLRACLVERLGLAAGASSACQSGIGYGLHMTSAQLAYHRNAVDAYRALAEDDADIDYRRHGGLVIGDPASDAERREAVAPLRAAGFEAEWLDRADLAELEPALSPSIEGAVRLDDLATVSPMKVVGELVRRANRRGASILVETEFQGVRRAKGRLSSVLTSRGAIATEWLVIAAGAWSRQAGRLVGLQVPVWPLKGHVLVTEPAWGLVGHYLSDASYEASVEAIRATPLGPDGPESGGPESGGPAVLASVIQPLPSGSYLIGSSREFAGFDRDVDRHRLEELADRARRIVPALAGLRVLRAYAGLRPWSPDGRPLIGRTTAFEGLALATGHAGDGNTGALITGRLLASDLTGTPPVVDLAPYAPDRFDLERGHEGATRPAPSPRSTESR